MSNQATPRTGVWFQGGLKIKAATELAVRAEEAGVDSIWVAEGPVTRDAFITLSALALATNRVDLATGVVNPFTRHPAQLAATFATLDELSQGRAICGIGIGARDGLIPLGADVSKPLTAAREMVSIIRSLLARDEVILDGAVFKMDHVRLGLRPYRESMPIYLAATGPKMCALAGESADGIYLLYGTQEYVKSSLNLAHAARTVTEPLRVASPILMAVGDNDDDAVNGVKIGIGLMLTEPNGEAMLEANGVDPALAQPIRDGLANGGVKALIEVVDNSIIDRLTIVGTHAQCVERLQEAVSWGISEPQILLTGDDPSALLAVLDDLEIEFLMSDENLTELQRDLVEHARKIASEFSLTYWHEKDEAAEYPWEFVRAFADAGYMGIIVPTEYGGLGLGITEAALLLREIAASGAGTSGASAVHFYVFPPAPIIHHGSDEMKSKFLPQMAKGELLMAFGVTEPNSGSDTSRTSTKAVRDGDRWLINGQKVWTTNAQNASHILLLTRTSPRDEEHPHEGMTLFFVPLDREHCTIRVIKKLGRAAVDSNELFMDNLEAQDADIVGEIGKGFYHLITGLNPERIVLAMEAVGIGLAALRLATDYARERVVFNNPIGSYQAVAHPLADSWARLQGAELMAMRAADLFDQGKHCGAEANAAKYLAADAGFQACDAALQTHGGFGYAREYHIERLWREARLFRLAPVSQEMVLNYLSERVLGLPKSY